MAARQLLDGKRARHVSQIARFLFVVFPIFAAFDLSSAASR